MNALRLFGFLSKKAPAPNAEAGTNKEAEESFDDESAETILGLAQASQEYADGAGLPDDALNETLTDFVQEIQTHDARDGAETEGAETEGAVTKDTALENDALENDAPKDDVPEDTDTEIILDLADDLVDDPAPFLLEAPDTPFTPDALFPEITAETPPKTGRVKMLVWSFLLAITVTALLGATAFGTYLYALKQAPSARDIVQLEGQGLNVTAVSFERIDSQLGETLLINIDLQNNSQQAQKLGKIDIYLTGAQEKVLASWQIDTSGQQLDQQERTAITTRLFTIPEGLQNVMAVHHSTARE